MPNRMDRTVSTRPGQKRTTRPKSRAIRPRSARARQLAANVLNRCLYLPSPLMSASSSATVVAGFVFGRLVDCCVELRAKQHHRSAEVEIQEQTHGGPDAPVREAEGGKIGQVEGEGHRGDRPQRYGQRRAEGDRPETLPGIGTETVDHGEHGAKQKKGYGEAQPTPQAHEQLVEVPQLSHATHQ